MGFTLDLYVVCGQAQTSLKYVFNYSNLFTHLLAREEKRLDTRKLTRIEKGSQDKISEIQEKNEIYKTNLHIVIVQPGFSKTKGSSEQLELLAVTETYLTETYAIPLKIIASA